MLSTGNPMESTTWMWYALVDPMPVWMIPFWIPSLPSSFSSPCRTSSPFASLIMIVLFVSNAYSDIGLFLSPRSFG
ncbi:MAG: hypothetical protein BWY82_02892 [Verrucomicrobia bacterium ADurb.Bin474]|nr:MAG: hypothetical protein BWY82_02892 [Verrucomicrobia bacterium ADurb.Bin474]